MSATTVTRHQQSLTTRAGHSCARKLVKMVAGSAPRARGTVRTLGVLTIVALLATSCGASESAAPGGETVGGQATFSRDIDTLKEGVLTVGVFSYMPYVGVENDRITGVEGELIYEVAERLNLEVEPVLSDFSGLLGAVQSRRVDVGVGSIGWTEDREKAGLFTDQTYYARQTVLHRNDIQVETISDLNGHTVGTGIGYAYIEALQNMPGVDLRTYPDAATMLRDVELGRIDAVLSDPLINIAYAREHPDQLVASALQRPTDAELEEHPEWVNFVDGSAAWYVPTENPELAKALSRIISDFYDDGTLALAFEQHGVEEPDEWLRPPPQATTMRVGVDRPEGWSAPSVDN